jgi:hypothetical protein
LYILTGLAARAFFICSTLVIARFANASGRRSPLVEEPDDVFQRPFLSINGRITDRNEVARHYLERLVDGCGYIIGIHSLG